MCTSPIKIKNRSKDPLANPYLFVPCGKCLACQKSKSDGIEYRAIKEYDWCLSHGGRAYMITFTYDDEHLPRARAFKAANRIGNKNIGIDYGAYNNVRDLRNQRPEYSDLKCPYPEYKDFFSHNKRDLQLFNKRLRARLKYYGYDVTLSYFIASEYGSDRSYIDQHGTRRKATKRPHYHAIYYLYPSTYGNIPSEHAFLNLAFDCWRKCSAQNFKSILIDNKITSAIGYVAKYVTKTEAYKEFGNRVFDVPCTFGLFDGDNLEIVEESQIAPFILVSKNFGAKHLLRKTINQLVTEFNHNATITNANGSVYQFPYPSYYKKKFLYTSECVENEEIHSYNVLISQNLPNVSFDEVITINECFTEMSIISKITDVYFPAYLTNQLNSFDRLYTSLTAYWYDLPDKPFSEEFLKYGLYDFMLTRYSLVHIATGEILQPEDSIISYIDGNITAYLSDYIIRQFWSVLRKKDHLHIRQTIEKFIDDYNRLQFKFRNDKLLIQKQKANKRAAERKFINQNLCANETSLKTLIRSHELRMQNRKSNSKT